MKHLYFIPKGYPRIIYRAITWSSLQRYSATVVFVCLLVGLWWLLHLRPLHRRLLAKQQALHEAQKSQKEFNKLQEKLLDLEIKFKELDREFLPKSPASFVAEWGSCAQKAGLFLISARTYEAPLESQTQPHTEESQQEVFYKKSLFIEFVVQGNFEAIQDLMQRLYAVSYRACLESYRIDRYHDDSLSCTFIYNFYL